MSKIDEVKSRLDIVDVISQYVELRKSGRSYSAFCPFHADARTPSFVVFPETQTWHCFGACGEGGDIFTFLMKRENLDFGDALAELAERAGVELEPPSPQKAAAQESGERLRKILAAAADFFQDALLNAPQAAHARAYVERRGLTPEQGAQTQIYLASSPEVAGITGKYFERCRAVPSDPGTYDSAAAARMWAASAELAGYPVN